MTTIQARLVGDHALLPRSQFERLLEIARRSEPIHLELAENDASTGDEMLLAKTGGAFRFWLDEGEDIYSANDGVPVR
jgi:hypothetical protein